MAGVFVFFVLLYVIAIGALLSLGGYILGYFFRKGWNRADGPPA